MNYDPEQVEKIRQAIMRYRELLDLAQASLAAGEKRYHRLFDAISPGLRETLPEKLLQREAALLALEDMEPLRRTILRMQFDLRDFERGFEEIYNHIAPDDEEGGR